MNTTDAAERIESLKAGLIGGSTGAMVALLILWFQATGSAQTADALEPAHFLALSQLEITGILQGAIAFLTSFLFGITYRYIIRQDSNPQLKAGGVLAFGLVRGLAQVESAIALKAAWLTVGIQVAESIGMIAIAALVLEGAIWQGWLKPFGKS
ncbi:MAG TPA: hypothetical protein V6C57_28330 [Coleofasciculaceae cyanobacterium]